MKRIILCALIINIALCCFGCSSSDNKENSSLVSKPSLSSSQDDKEDINFQEMTVIDNKKCLLKITELKKKDDVEYELRILCENKSDNKKYMFSLDSLSVNGLQLTPLFAKEVAAGKTAKDTISVYDEELEDNEISKITDIELSFRVYDSENLMSKDIANETVNIYPYGENEITTFLRKDDEDDFLLVDNENIKAVLIDYDEDDIWGYAAELYLVNKTDKQLMFSTDDVSINGVMANPLFAKSIKPAKSAFASISWSEDALKEIDINDFDEIKDIELTLRVYDYDNVLDEDIFKKKFNLKP